MAKKNKYYDYDDDDLVMDKKTKRRLERQKNRENQQLHQQQMAETTENDAQCEPEEPADDTMSQIALLCQENRWCEAVLIGRNALKTAQLEGKEEMVLPLSMALEKLEMSLRRQVASAFISSAKEMLKKEYDLNVGE